ncbi:DNA-binding response regulator [Zoogloea oryzae]|uniref:DNA-binding response regulator n=2 Tax=Zoogloea oryzae TaxID=310767 RepID=A0ABQ6FDK9_9RHOO|nr:DNA-binding response regulator [Zoogloea oryzae]
MRVALISSFMAFSSALHAALLRGGFSVQRYEDEAQLARDAGQIHFDVLLVDAAGLVGHVSRSLCRLAGRDGFDAALIFFNGPDREPLLADAFTHGADDFIRRGTGHRELLARIEAVLRRRMRSHVIGRPVALQVAPYAFDLNARIARLHGVTVPLTDREFDLALLLFRNIGRLFSRDHLLATFWHGQYSSRTVDTHVSRVRRRLMLDARHGLRLVSEYGRGYRLKRVRASRAAPGHEATRPADGSAP